MRLSTLFFKTKKTNPKDETAINAKLLIRANFVDKLMAGVYSFLPLGFRVRSKIIKIIEEEMNNLGAAEMIMPALHPKSSWEPSGRWETLSPIMYQFKDHSNKDVGLGATHEEIIAAIAKNIIGSYADLPKAVYQIQTKFRDEKRAKSGILRGREFTMKDLYSFHKDEMCLDEFYEKVKESYLRVFKRCGLKAYVTEASGGDFSKSFSHEFMVEAAVGEDEIFLCRLCGFARNKEIADFKNKEICPSCQSGVLEKVKSIEVGNIFKLGIKYSEAVGLNFKDADGSPKPVIMGSYGIGVERLMGTVVEIWNDEKGIIWPDSIAPFLVHLITLSSERDVVNFGEKVYNFLIKDGIEVLWDDRSKVTPGEKFFDADLIGCPYKIVVSEKLVLQNKIELGKRNNNSVKILNLKEAVKLIKQRGF